MATEPRIPIPSSERQRIKPISKGFFRCFRPAWKTSIAQIASELAALRKEQAAQAAASLEFLSLIVREQRRLAAQDTSTEEL